MEIKTNEMKPAKSCDVTRGHEHYLSHILLLEQASPIALKAIIKREENKCGKDIGILLNENRDTFKTQYETEFLQLFQGDVVNDDIDTWDTLQLCAVTLALFKSDLTEPEVKAIQCIYDHRKDIEHYVERASLTYNTYKEKQHLLHEQLLELITLIDDQANLDCKRMVFSFESKSMQFSEPQIDKLTRTNDIKTHLKIAIDVVVVTENDITGEENDLDLQTTGQMFTEELQNTNVYINDSAILACKLSIPTDENVEWRKNSKPVKVSNNLVVVSNNENHWLAIFRASLEDTGQYTCVCGNISTSADLIVVDEALGVVIDLPVKIEAIENGNINITWKVNRLTRKPDWRHKGELLQSSGRKVILSKGTTHELMITNVSLHDEGEYTVNFENVSSKTTVQVQGETDLIHRKQIQEKLYRNWVRGALALKYLKIGLEGFSDKAVIEQHRDLMKTFGNTCNTCTMESLFPHKKNLCPRQRKYQCLCTKNHNKSRQMCPNGGFCGNFYDEIVCKHRFQNPLFMNTDVQNWSSDPWSVATCFINTTGYKGKQSAKDVDCSGLLSMCINNIYIENMLGKDIIDGEKDAFTKARKSRNDILHNPNYELSENELNIFIKGFKEVLEIKDKHGNTPLKGEPSVENALYLLDKLQQNQIEINLEHEIKQLREHGMLTLDEKYKTAKEQHELKLQRIAQQIKDQEEELGLMLNLRYSGKQNNPKETFLLELQISVIAKSGEKSPDGNRRVYEVMKDYINNDDRSSDTPVYHLLNYIKAIKECHIVGISPTYQSSTDIQIKCLSSEAMENFLKSINCNAFQQELFKLRRWLHVQYDIDSHDIIANCSQNGLEKAKQRLHFTDVTRIMTCTEHQNTQCTLYCPDHDMFFCTACRESRHGTCLGIKQVISERSYVEQKRRLNIKSIKGTYNVRIDNALINRDKNDQDECGITSMCMLPNSELLLADFGNNKLKKLNSSYKVISYCGVPEDRYLYSVCYIGNDIVVAVLRGNSIQYVNVSSNVSLRQLVKLDHDCLGLACHGDTLYINSGDKIYKYDENCTQQQVLYPYPHKVSSPFIVVSDNGYRLYFSADKGLTTIDCKGNLLFSEQVDGYKIFDSCIADEGIVLVLDAANNVHQLDYNGKKHWTVDNMPLEMLVPFSMCFDRERCRLIVGGFEGMIYVYKCEYLPS
ncbi:uncharacterized protein LOC132749599 isoform X2 [Ruditapes philippinarum]|uniref:uncharacterized protein LOC132749599 isoform X2 n=1 Tax=Ruditapes philippinarum TaxID=129788 RepID=UPI00295B9F0D|nr:uncharacterized protein LOC132749599 isoform X2 [Ruditapes philippinarum]